MSRKLLGLDIRRDAISAVVVKSGIKGSWIENYIHVPITSEETAFEEGLKQSLESVSGQLDLTDAVCLVSLPAVDVAYRTLKAPFKEAKKVRQILPFELETDLPYPAEDTVFDFSMLASSLETDTHQIFAAAIEKQHISERVDLLKSFNLEPDVLTVGGYAMGQYLSRMSEEKRCLMFLDLGDTYTTMVLSLSGEVCLVRTFPIVASDTIKIRAICTQINRTLLSFEQKSGLNCDIHEIRITGSNVTGSDVDQDLETFFGAPVTRADLLESSGKIVLSSKGENWQPFLMDGALSLVLNELSGFDVLNFRRGRMGMEKIWLENKKDIIKTCCLGVLLHCCFWATVS